MAYGQNIDIKELKYQNLLNHRLRSLIPASLNIATAVHHYAGCGVKARLDVTWGCGKVAQTNRCLNTR